MTISHHKRTDCRLCGATDLSLALSLTPTPPANAFVREDALNAEQAVFPLDVHFCNACAHAQLLDVVDPGELFGHYVYVSGTSPVFIRHFEDYAASVLARFRPPADSLVVDIGSNDGTLLGFFQKAGLQVLGVDPAKEIARHANEHGIETLNAFFDPALARTIVGARGEAHIVTANNVLAHVDDLAGIVDGVRDLLTDDGVFVFEVSYLGAVVEHVLFDTIYHEHLAYHSVKPLVGFFAAHGMTLTAVERIDSHGGSIRGFARKSSAGHEGDGSVEECIRDEERRGLDRAETLTALGRRIDDVKARLGRRLAEMKNAGKSIAGYGAPAKATTLMYHFGLDGTVIDFIVDDSEWKQGLYSPGLHLPVVAADAIYERRPDCLLILAWNFAEPIIANHQAFRDAGGTFIVPLPDVRVL